LEWTFGYRHRDSTPPAGQRDGIVRNRYHSFIAISTKPKGPELELQVLDAQRRIRVVAYSPYDPENVRRRK